MLSTDTIVRRMRVRGNTADALRLQQRVVALTAAADLHAPSMSRQAILCIRQLSDPRPRSIGLADHRVRPRSEWEAAARSTVAALAARAVRPARGVVPASAEAVLFLDRAELLACLASDWADGVLASCWWWHALFGAMDIAGVVREWRATPERVPAACQVLAARGRLDRFVRRLPAAEAATLACDVARTFNLDAVDRAVRAHATEPGGTPDPAAHSGTATEAPRPHTRASVSDHAAWARHVPELTHSGMAPEQRLLAVVSLIVHRSPSAARRLLSADVAASILAGETATPAERPLGAAGRSARQAHENARTRAIEPRLEVGGAGPTDAPASGERTPEHAASGHAAGASDGDAAERSVQREVVPAPAPRPIEARVETEFGGVFLLVNVGIAMGLYGDFTAPSSPGIDLPIWDFIVLVSERLLDDERFRHDPVGPFLARLAGRDPSEPPGATFVPGDAETVDAWLDALVPRVLTRLTAALAVNEGAAASLVCRRAARVSLSPSHLDIAFAIEDLPIQVRLAGLDRDPGFVPAAGLTITFSYV